MRQSQCTAACEKSSPAVQYFSTIEQCSPTPAFANNSTRQQAVQRASRRSPHLRAARQAPGTASMQPCNHATMQPCNHATILVHIRLLHDHVLVTVTIIVLLYTDGAIMFLPSESPGPPD